MVLEGLVNVRLTQNVTFTDIKLAKRLTYNHLTCVRNSEVFIWVAIPPTVPKRGAHTQRKL